MFMDGGVLQSLSFSVLICKMGMCTKNIYFRIWEVKEPVGEQRRETRMRKKGTSKWRIIEQVPQWAAEAFSCWESSGCLCKTDSRVGEGAGILYMKSCEPLFEGH